MKNTSYILLLMSALIFQSGTVISATGTIDVASQFTVNETANRLENIFKSKGVTIFNRINHSDAAEKIGVKLRATELIIFGNPKLGSPLMACQQSMAIDLPQKALIWEDVKGITWISYNDMKYLADRHDLNGCKKNIIKIAKILSKIINSAARNK